MADIAADTWVDRTEEDSLEDIVVDTSVHHICTARDSTVGIVVDTLVGPFVGNSGNCTFEHIGTSYFPFCISCSSSS